MATRTSLRLSLAVVAIVVLAAPSAMAQVDGRIHDDAAACLDARGVDPEAPGARQSTCVVAYAHIHHTVAQFREHALLLQRPPDDAVEVEAGPASPTLPPYYEGNVLELQLQAGDAEYDDAGIRSFRERMRLDVGGDVAWQATAFLTVDQTMMMGTGLEIPTPMLGAGALPCVTVRAEVLVDEDDRITVLSAAETIAHIVRPAVPVPDVCGAGPAAVMHPDGVTEITLDLPAIDQDIETHERIILRWSTHMVDAHGSEVMPQGIRWVHGPERPIRIVIPVEEAVRIEKVAPTWHDGLLYVLVDVSSPWGQHDVDLEAMRLDVLDDTGAVVASSADGAIAAPVIRYSVEHGAYPLSLHYVFDLLATPLPYGEYTLRVTAENGQNTGRDIADAAFWWEDGFLHAYDVEGNLTSSARLEESQEATFPSVLPILGTVAFAALVMRRAARRS